ncbi:RNA 2',3'-cyclic phosphodiesterase [Candidatus Margulisiibacteriota bacterium]
MRTFISVEIPDDIKKNIENLIEEFKKNLTPIKWVESRNLHITLKFLGGTDDKKIENLCGLVGSIAKERGSFKVSIGGLGAFPTTKNPRVLWVGISDGAETLIKIAEDLEGRLLKEGYKEEEKEFSAHITIGRIKEKIDIQELEKHIDIKKDVDLGSFDAKYISVMKSTLTQTGPIYEEIKRINFGQ